MLDAGMALGVGVGGGLGRGVRLDGAGGRCHGGWCQDCSIVHALIIHALSQTWFLRPL